MQRRLLTEFTGGISKVFETFGLSGPIQNTILALCSASSAFVLTEGLFSETFRIMNGTRQGCPLAPLIFALIMEPLAEKIRSDPNIQGIITHKHQHTISLFADDITPYLSNPTTSLPAAHEILLLFGNVSFYKVNATQSNILGISMYTNMELSLKMNLPHPWTNDSKTYFGIKLTSALSRLYHINYTPLINAFQQELSRLQKHFLTWPGHLAACKMLLLPKLIYYFRALPIPIPASFFTTMQKPLLKCVWAGSRARCSPHIQSRHKSVGGYGSTGIGRLLYSSCLRPTQKLFPYTHYQTLVSNRTYVVEQQIPTLPSNGH